MTTTQSSILKYFEEDLKRRDTCYFIFDSKGGGAYGDVDFVRYEWQPSKYSLPKEGDLFLYRRPNKSSETGDFYFFGACRIGKITTSSKLHWVVASFDKTYPFEQYVRKQDLDNFEWKWKQRGNTWSNFFNQYGMNKILKEDFVGILQLSGSYAEQDQVDIEEEVKAIQSIQKKSFFAPDVSAQTKVRSQQKAFSDKVKANYGFACCICGLANRDFLVGSHIVPWAESKESRLDPANGLCLYAFHDKAFEYGYLSLGDDYLILVRDDCKNDQVLYRLLASLSTQRIRLPSSDRPSLEYLRWHRENKYKQKRK